MATALLPAPPSTPALDADDAPEILRVLAEHGPVAGPDTGQTPTRCAHCTTAAGTPIPWPCPAVHEIAEVETRPHGWELRPYDPPAR